MSYSSKQLVSKHWTLGRGKAIRVGNGYVDHPDLYLAKAQNILTWSTLERDSYLSINKKPSIHKVRLNPVVFNTFAVLLHSLSLLSPSTLSLSSCLVFDNRPPNTVNSKDKKPLQDFKTLAISIHFLPLPLQCDRALSLHAHIYTNLCAGLFCSIRYF